MTALVVGVGAVDRGDDGVGVAVVEDLRRRALPGVDLCVATSPTRLLDVWTGHSPVVVVDAAATGTRPAGTVTLVDVGARPLPGHGGPAGTHGFGVADTVELARALDRLPDRLVLVTVEATRFDQGSPPSPAVAAAVPAAADAAVQALFPEDQTRPGRVELLGVGAMNSPRYRPAGLAVHAGGRCLLIDGGDPRGLPEHVDAWLVCDDRSELMPRIRRLARRYSLEPVVTAQIVGDVVVTPLPVRHTSHPTFGYLLVAGARRAAWAPEFWRYPEWATDLDLLFAEAAGWSRPIRFRGGVGGHACVLDVSRAARESGVRRLVFAHIGRPTIAALDAGREVEFGEFGSDGQAFNLDLDPPA
ncbi:MAG TPA: hydrogenase maturation protease [Kineosporiaceae bacterium]|nr:hydrogenase maturation protease [Kineosporiaceae bacterium]